jgi:hypothetical protein
MCNIAVENLILFYVHDISTAEVNPTKLCFQIFAVKLERLYHKTNAWPTFI